MNRERARSWYNHTIVILRSDLQFCRVETGGHPKRTQS